MEQRDVSYLFRRDAMEHQRRVASITGSVSSAETLSLRQWAVTLLVLVGLSVALIPLLDYTPTASVRVATARWSAEDKLIVDLQHTSRVAGAAFSPGNTVTLNTTSANVRLSSLCLVTSVIDGASGSTERLVLDVSEPVRRAMKTQGDEVQLDLEFKNPRATLGAALKRMLWSARS